MRVSWTNRRRLTVLMATFVALHGAGAASAQVAQYSYPGQAQQPSYGVQQEPLGYAAQQPAPRYAAQPPMSGDTIRVASLPRYNTVMAYQVNNAPTPAVDPVPPVPPMPVEEGITQGNPMPNVYENSPVYQGDRGYYGTYDGCGCLYNTFNCGDTYRYGGLETCCQRHRCMQDCYCGYGNRWFGGVYGLMMERDGNSEVPLAFVTTNGVGTFPADAEVALTTSDADVGFQGGLEIRFGSYFGGVVGCNPRDCRPRRAWEAVYWGLFEDSNTSVITDTTGDATRTFGMIDFTGLQYDDGGGPRSVNVYFDTGLPITDNTAPVDVEIRSLTVRGTFQLQNFEANLLRLPVLNGGANSRYELATSVGFRFMRIDDDFSLRSDFEIDPTGAATLDSLTYGVETDNTLYGAQIGGNGSYRVGSGRLSLHCDTAVGLYGNHMSATQRMTGATFVVGGTPMLVENEEDDISVVGEMRVGASYQCHNNWRLYGGWRVVGLTGVARATDQIPSQFITPGQIGIATDGSMLVHGLQTGMEFSY